MKVLVTGANGFIGSWLVRYFCSTGRDVTAMVRQRAIKDNRLADVTCEFLEHDLRNELSIDNTFDVILHAGGNPSAADSLVSPMRSVADNVVGTCNILEFARKNNSHFVYYSSGEVFGPKPLGVESDPDAAYNSASPYAATKAGGEELAVSFANSFGLKVSIIHINNTFGERLQRERFPAVVIRKLLTGENIQVHSGPNGEVSGRRWFHAEDVARHTEHILSAQTSNCEKWNTAGERFINNHEFAQMIARQMNVGATIELIPTDRPGHDVSYNVNPAKLYDTGYRNVYTTEQRLRQMIDWTLQNKEWL